MTKQLLKMHVHETQILKLISNQVTIDTKANNTLMKHVGMKSSLIPTLKTCYQFFGISKYVSHTYSIKYMICEIEGECQCKLLQLGKLLHSPIIMKYY
jgi:hypothetical protein